MTRSALHLSRYPPPHRVRGSRCVPRTAHPALRTQREPPGGAAGTRTPDLRRAKAALSQLSYGPAPRSAPVGAPGLEPGASALSGPRSDHLSYAPRRPRRRCAEDGVSTRSTPPRHSPATPARPPSAATRVAARSRSALGREPAASPPLGLTIGIVVRCAALPRKEVIQPQLPLRLPCYDFVPITHPTLDGCLPCGLAHRLQVLPAFMT